jgi:hypothetical protein
LLFSQYIFGIFKKEKENDLVQIERWKNALKGFLK